MGNGNHEPWDITNAEFKGFVKSELGNIKTNLKDMPKQFAPKYVEKLAWLILGVFFTLFGLMGVGMWQQAVQASPTDYHESEQNIPEISYTHETITEQYRITKEGVLWAQPS